jgi:hypothetical protein
MNIFEIVNQEELGVVCHDSRGFVVYINGDLKLLTQDREEAVRHCEHGVIAASSYVPSKLVKNIDKLSVSTLKKRLKSVTDVWSVLVSPYWGPIETRKTDSATDYPLQHASYEMRIVEKELKKRTLLN